MTKKEREKLAQVIDAKYIYWRTDVVLPERGDDSFTDERQAEIIDLITEFDRPFKGQQHKNSVRKRSKIPTGRTVTVTNQSGRKVRQSVRPVKLPEEE